MNKSTLYCFITAVVVSVCILRYGEAAEPPEASLAVSLSVRQKEVILGEPLMCHLVITNRSANTVRFLPRTWGVGEIWISLDGEKYELTFDRSLGSTDCYNAQYLQANQSVTSDIIVLQKIWIKRDDSGVRYGSPPIYIFSKPGKYWVQGRYRGFDDKQVISDSVIISVTEPPATEQPVWTRLRDMAEYGVLIQYPEFGIPDQVKTTFETIVQENPKSTYSHYLALALGKHYRFRTGQMGGQPLDSATVKNARSQTLRHFQVAAGMNTVPALREEGMIRLASELFLDRSRTQEAIQILRQAITEFPEGRHKQRAKDLLQRFDSQSDSQKAKP